MLAPLFGLIDVIEEPQSRYRRHGRNGFWTPALEDKINALLGWYEPRARALADMQCRLGLPLPRSGYVSPYMNWLRRLQAVTIELRDSLPPEERFLLLDGGEWTDRLLADREHVPFTERDGVYWGPPADDAGAVAELERQIDRGIRHVVIGWPAFWYLDCYPGLLAHLESVSSSEDVRVYRVRTQS